MYFQEVRVV